MPQRPVFLLAMLRPVKRSIAIAVVVLVAASAAYWGFASWQKRTQQAAIASAVGEASVALRQGLGRAPAGDEPKRIEAAMEKLRAANPTRQRDLAEAAEIYLVSARAVVERRAEAARLAQQASASRRQLIAHMASRTRGEAWIRQATELKKRMDQAYFDENVALEALADLLRGLPDSEERIAPQVGKAALVEASVVESAAEQAKADLKRASSERSTASGLIPR